MMGHFVHHLADCQSDDIGDDTRIWQYSVILKHARIGKNCNISAHCFIEGDVVIGDNVTVKCGVYLWDGLRIGNNVFIGPNVTFTNDKYPRSKDYSNVFLKTVIHMGATIGGGAIILPGIEVGEYSMVAAGAVVTKSVPPNMLAIGVPAIFKKLPSSVGGSARG